MKTLHIITLFFVSCFCFGQNRQIDSLKNELSKAKSDTTKVLIYEKLIGTAPNDKAAIEYGLKGMELAKRIRFAKGEILCGNRVGFLLVQIDYYSAIPILMATKDLCEKTHNQKELVRALGFLGYAYGYVDYQKALFYYHECEKLMAKANMSEDNLPISTAMGYLYKDHGSLDTALIYLQKGYQLSLKSDKYPIRPNIFYIHFGEIYYKKGQKDLAMRYFRQSIAAYKEKPIGQPYYDIALVFRDNNQLDSAKFYARKSLEVEQKDSRATYVIKSANLLFELYRPNPAEALKYHLIATAAKDSLFSQDKARQVEKLAYEEREREALNQRKLESRKVALENQIKIYGLTALLLGLMIFAFVLYRNNRSKQKVNILLHQQKEEIDLQRNKAEMALSELKATQKQLIQSEKLASLGELTAGIAHEIQNPLNFVNNFSELSIELIEEIAPQPPEGELNAPPLGVGATVAKEVDWEILQDIRSNLQKINHHGKRASSIVKGMLEHSRANTGERALTDINELADEYLRLSYHGMRAKDKTFNASFELVADKNLPKIMVVSQDIGRVLLNLINNAFQSPNSPLTPRGGTFITKKVIVSTRFIADENSPSGGWGAVFVSDNGNGIPKENLEKIFQPFFTTKPTGEGTGLGLSLSYDIITKGHGGTLEVISTEGEGTEFIIKLPI